MFEYPLKMCVFLGVLGVKALVGTSNKEKAQVSKYCEKYMRNLVDISSVWGAGTVMTLLGSISTYLQHNKQITA